MMNWQDNWSYLGARIASLLQTGEFFTHALGARWREVPWQIVEDVVRNADNTYFAIQDFKSEHRESVPPKAMVRLQEFINGYFNLFLRGDPTVQKQNDIANGYERIVSRLTFLASFQSEFNHLISDRELSIRSMLDRAFLHLRRSIVADPSVSLRWQEAFEKGEVACEKLGGAHLLSFGIYSFKAASPGERTDLILGTPLEITAEVRSAVDALVLTEWKKVASAAEAPRKAVEAFEQAKMYGQGVLSGFELSSRRYLVLVSKEQLIPLPADRTEGGVVYQFNNIAVRPLPPSVRAKR
ncbi:MAG: hypothetical protein Q7S58_12950 [Candidatus Binatus sp.]|uniref:hypothetical protein n=1 Tax=Candidatus Binatus sp. TaxID=2811406 RepID=UPI002718D7B6|nr:hypothetical protein [Candidatus Binatus sp.]MDO8433308.1 hypothetical protein [Candidatus Binatus sp.]